MDEGSSHKVERNNLDASPQSKRGGDQKLQVRDDAKDEEVLRGDKPDSHSFQVEHEEEEVISCK